MEKVYYFVISEFYKCGEFEYFDEIAFESRKQAKNFLNKYRCCYPFGNAKVRKITESTLKAQAKELGCLVVSFYNMKKHQKNEMVYIKY